MNAVATTLLAIAALTAATASVAHAEDGQAHVMTAAEEALTLQGEFSMTMWVEAGAEDGFVAGNPGRAALTLEGDEMVFTIGGDDALSGIFRESYSVRAQVNRSEWIHVAATFGDDGMMTLAVSSDEGEMSVVVGGADTGLLEQLDMMEELVDGVTCSDGFYTAGAPNKCVPTIGNSNARVEDVRVYERTLNSAELVPVPGC